MNAFQDGGDGRPAIEGGSVEVAIRDDHVDVLLDGQVDARLSDDLDQAAVDALRPGTRIDVLCGSVTFMDSTGIAFLARLAGRSSDRVVRLLEPPPVVAFLVETVKIGHLVEVVPGPPT